MDRAAGSDRTDRPDRKSADTLDRILEVAETAFAREGYEGAHLQFIAGQVGVQKTALYYYFPSKAALYEAVLQRILIRVDETIREAIESEGGHADRLRRVSDDINALFAANPNVSQILIRVFVDRPRIDSGEILPLVESLIGRLLAFFKAGMDAGAFEKGSSRQLFQTFFGATVFHYATAELGAAVLGVPDVFDADAVAWRRDEIRRTVERAILACAD